MYDREYVGHIQIKDLKKNNDYAMLFEITKNPVLQLPECLSYYIKHEDSILSESNLRLIKHHYILYINDLKKSPNISSTYDKQLVLGCSKENKI